MKRFLNFAALLLICLLLFSQALFAQNRQKTSAGVRIVNPSTDAIIVPGQPLNVKVTMNQAAVGVATRIEVLLKKDRQNIARAVINNPQAANRVTLQVPADIGTGPVSVEAYAYPFEGLTGNGSIVTLTAQN